MCINTVQIFETFRSKLLDSYYTQSRTPQAYNVLSLLNISMEFCYWSHFLKKTKVENIQ